MKKLLFALLISSAPILLGMEQDKNAQSDKKTMEPDKKAPRKVLCPVCRSGIYEFTKHVTYAEDLSQGAWNYLCSQHKQEIITKKVFLTHADK